MGNLFSQDANKTVDTAVSKTTKAVDKGAKQTKQAVKDTGKAVKSAATSASTSTSTSTKKKDNTLVELLPFMVTAVGIGIVWLVREKPWEKKNKPAAPTK